jgi:hypothetical protein
VAIAFEVSENLLLLELAMLKSYRDSIGIAASIGKALLRSNAGEFAIQARQSKRLYHRPPQDIGPTRTTFLPNHKSIGLESNSMPQPHLRRAGDRKLRHIDNHCGLPSGAEDNVRYFPQVPLKRNLTPEQEAVTRPFHKVGFCSFADLDGEPIEALEKLLELANRLGLIQMPA